MPLAELSFGLLVSPTVWDWSVQWRERRRGLYTRLLPHGPHNIRDVLATHILKQTGSYEQASYAIQDTPEVVAKHYGRFFPARQSSPGCQHPQSGLVGGMTATSANSADSKAQQFARVGTIHCLNSDLKQAETSCYMMTVPETLPRDPNF